MTNKSNTKLRQIDSDDELTIRWTKFLNFFITSGNARQSAIQAGFSESYADVITTRFPDKVRESLNIALEQKGITSEKIAEKINLLLDASTPIYKNNYETGESEHVGDKPDYQAVDKGITHAIKIGVGGGYAAEKSLALNVNVGLDNIQDEDLNALREEYEAKLRSKYTDEKGN